MTTAEKRTEIRHRLGAYLRDVVAEPPEGLPEELLALWPREVLLVAEYLLSAKL